MIRWLSFILMLAAPLSDARSSIQPLEGIREVVETYVRQQLGMQVGQENLHVQVGQLDQRLRLGRCEQPLEPFFPSGLKQQGNISVGVRCTGMRPWSLYVPVMVKAFQEVVVLARALPMGAILSISDIQMERRDTGSVLAYFTDLAQVTNMTLTQALGANAILTPQVLRAPIVIRRRQSVSLVVKADGLEVRMAGEALSDASAGQLVKVRNLTSKRVVEGVVSQEGVIFVQGR